MVVFRAARPSGQTDPGATPTFRDRSSETDLIGVVEMAALINRLITRGCDDISRSS